MFGLRGVGWNAGDLERVPNAFDRRTLKDASSSPPIRNEGNFFYLPLVLTVWGCLPSVGALAGEP
jgi:hypothetical protein